MIVPFRRADYRRCAVHTVTGRVCMPAYNPLRLIARKNDSRRFSNWIRERVRLVSGAGAEKFPILRREARVGDVVVQQRRCGGGGSGSALRGYGYSNTRP